MVSDAHEALLAFLADVSDQADVFESCWHQPIVKIVMDDLRSRVIAEGVVVKLAASGEV